MIYNFFWDDGDGKESELIEINATSSTAVKQKVIEKLLDSYRENNDEYNIDDWVKYLERYGYKAKIISSDHSMYF